MAPKKKRVRRPFKRIGQGRNMYPISRGAMGGGGPYFITQPQVQLPPSYVQKMEENLKMQKMILESKTLQAKEGIVERQVNADISQNESSAVIAEAKANVAGRREEALTAQMESKATSSTLRNVKEGLVMTGTYARPVAKVAGAALIGGLVGMGGVQSAAKGATKVGVGIGKDVATGVIQGAKESLPSFPSVPSIHDVAGSVGEKIIQGAEYVAQVPPGSLTTEERKVVLEYQDAKEIADNYIKEKRKEKATKVGYSVMGAGLGTAALQWAGYI